MRKNLLAVVVVAVIGLAVLFALTGCGPEATITMRKEMYQQSRTGSPVEVTDLMSRFTITRVGVFEDDLAYNQKRAIYLLIDQQTGEQFVGVSGIGISELGRHSSGKTSVSDER